ncbi:MAG: hypothetical protein IPI58_00115 [Alphaproteobacteria bacterium]|nr:MAG: hypothetical protein IPI58_00115 [Alphaproteobacteria bacterium]
MTDSGDSALNVPLVMARWLRTLEGFDASVENLYREDSSYDVPSIERVIDTDPLIKAAAHIRSQMIQTLCGLSEADSRACAAFKLERQNGYWAWRHAADLMPLASDEEKLFEQICDQLTRPWDQPGMLRACNLLRLYPWRHVWRAPIQMYGLASPLLVQNYIETMLHEPSWLMQREDAGLLAQHRVGLFSTSEKWLLDNSIPTPARKAAALMLLDWGRTAACLAADIDLSGSLSARHRMIDAAAGLFTDSDGASAQEGHHAAPPPAKTKRRVGIMCESVHPTPRAWSVLAIAMALPADMFEIVILTPDYDISFTANADFSRPLFNRIDRIHKLIGTPAQVRVALREEDLDVLILAITPFQGGKFDYVLRERFAPRQYLMDRFWPAHVDRLVVDAVISENVDATAWTNAPVVAIGPAAQFSPMACSVLARHESLSRASLGLTQDQPVLFALPPGITMTADIPQMWVEALVAVPGSVLLISPYPHAQDITLRHALTQACQSRGINADRLRFLSDLNAGDLRQLFAMADVCLASDMGFAPLSLNDVLGAGGVPVLVASAGARGDRARSWMRGHGLEDLCISQDEHAGAHMARLLEDSKELQSWRCRIAKLAQQDDGERLAGAVKAASAVLPDALVRP